MAMTVEEARAALDAAEAKLASAGTTRERIAASREAAEARKDLQAANAAARAEAAAAREEAAAAARAKAEAERPKTGAEMAKNLMGVRPVLPEESGGDVFPGYFEYKPMDEQGRQAIFGWNPATGKPYTDEESAAANAGYNPWAGAVGYEIDPRTGNLNVLLSSGNVMTTGAKYQMSSAGYVIPQEGSLPPGVGSDEYGRYYEPGTRMPNESIAAWIKRLSARGPGVLFDGGKTYQYDASGKFYIEGETKPPAGFGSTSFTSVPGTSSATSSPLVSGNGSNLPTSYQGIVDKFTGKNLTPEQAQQRESAFAILKKEFDRYGLGTLADTLKTLIIQGSPVEEVVLRLRETPQYQQRFAGNLMRLRAGLNVYDEATYLDLENAYDQIFTAYGVAEAAGNTLEARRARYANFIGGTISPDEVKGRVQLAVAAANEDEVTKATLRELYPMISDKDIVSYFLNPKETLPKLETKVRASQIGAAAVRQGLVTNVATAEELAAMGVTEEEAEKAYSAYAGMKPRLDLLSGLEKDQGLLVNQKVAEDALLKGLASEQRKLEGLRQKELARFSGSAGTARGVSLGSATGGTY